MSRTVILCLILGGLAAGALACFPGSDGEAGGKMPLLEGVGDHHHAISSEVPEARRYFDQGLVLAWGFNHRGAKRSFHQAARLDPECAICWWGVALSLGPNINAGMNPEAVPEAWAALQRARELSDGASPRERAYIDALSARYDSAPPEDRSRLDSAYAEAMGELVERYPDDLDAAALRAEALMVLHPWDYWAEDGSPKPWTPEILRVLEGVLEREPDHLFANHLYIHAVEASPEPERGLEAARRLVDLVPGAGHLQHMPAHIFLRTGRYHRASLANERGIRADSVYVAEADPSGLYPVGYVPHNHHFLVATASLEGRSERAIRAARDLAALVDTTLMREPGYGTLQHYRYTRLYALVRFGRWEEILSEPEPPEDLLYPRGLWHFARGMAYARTGRPERAGEELAALRPLSEDERLEEVTIWELNTTRSLLSIGREVLAGELAAARGDHREAARRLRRAVELEEALNYDEPPPWLQPVRHSLGAVLLEAGRPADAESVYRANLERYPENGWALFGLSLALRQQGRTEEARETARRFEEAWRHADVTLQSSRF